MRLQLIKARKKMRLTQAQLGMLVGASNKTVSHLERGRVKGGADIWDSLEKVLGVPRKKLRRESATEESRGY
jgi:DNA-binding XRE family transcriptional regulator